MLAELKALTAKLHMAIGLPTTKRKSPSHFSDTKVSRNRRGLTPKPEQKTAMHKLHTTRSSSSPSNTADQHTIKSAFPTITARTTVGETKKQQTTQIPGSGGKEVEGALNNPMLVAAPCWVRFSSY